MVRTLRLVMVVALVALATGCNSEEGASGASKDGPAGEVTELAGTVNAKRAGTKRALTVGDKVFAADVVSTGEGASVAVRLFHNGAVWRIEGGKSRQLDQTAAWRAPKAAGGLAHRAGTDETAAAGRHGERSAVDTRATARAADNEAPAADLLKASEPPPPPPRATPPAAATPAAQPTPTPRPAPASRARRAPAPPPPAKRAAERAPAPPMARAKTTAAPRPAPGGRGIVGIKPGATGGGGGSAASGGTVGGAGLGLQGIGAGGGGASAPGTISDAKLAEKNREKRLRSRVVVQSSRADGELSHEVARRVVRRYVGLLRRCHEQALTRDPSIAGILDLRLTVGATGRVTNVVVAGTIRDKGMKDCIAAKARLFRFPAVKDGGGTTVLQRVSFTVR